MGEICTKHYDYSQLSCEQYSSERNIFEIKKSIFSNSSLPIPIEVNAFCSFWVIRLKELIVDDS